MCGTTLYRVIGLANSSIDRLNKYLGEHPRMLEYVYELRALRAVYYYYVMDLFGRCHWLFLLRGVLTR